MLSLQFITHQAGKYSYFKSVRMAPEGGCKWIQLRMKEASPEEVETVARQLKPLCKTHRATLILNNHMKLAQKLEMDGVHLGKKDMPVSKVRKILGEAFIIRNTASTFGDVKMHFSAGADHLGIGPFRSTATKKSLSPVLGLGGYASILSRVDECDIQIPVVAVGGIMTEDIPAIIKTGVDGITLSGAVLQVPNPVEETRKILNI